MLPTTKILFSEKNIEELFFFSLSKAKIIFFKSKTIIFFLKKKEDKAISFYFDKGNNYF